MLGARHSIKNKTQEYGQGLNTISQGPQAYIMLLKTSKLLMMKYLGVGELGGQICTTTVPANYEEHLQFHPADYFEEPKKNLCINK